VVDQDPVAAGLAGRAHDGDSAQGPSYGTNAASRSLSYDAQHRLTGDTLTAPGGATEASASYGYDTAGLMTSRTTTGTAGAGSETYGYDQAGRLTSWTKSSATTGYGYDSAGNRTSVTAGTTTTTAAYNARDQLTGTTAGSTTTTYGYTARGTITSVSGSGGTENLSYDAFDQLTSDGTASYTHDGLGRLAATGSSTFAYDGTSPGIVSDGIETYGRGPGGGLLSVSGASGAALAYTDQHGDLTATFTPTGTTLAGSTAYDPYGQTPVTAGTQHDLGYQGGWTDPATHRVATASRWYDPSTGAFTSHDATSQPPVPSANANPYAYGADDPMDSADPTGASACSPSGHGAPPPPLARGNGGSSGTRSSGSSGPRTDYNNLIARAISELAQGYRDFKLGMAILNILLQALLSPHTHGGGIHWGQIGVGLSLAASLGVGVSAAVAANPELAVLFVLAAGYHSCNTDTAPPPPPPPTAESGLKQNPGPRPTGQPNSNESPAQNGTKNGNTGPGDTNPSHPSGAAPTSVTDPTGYQPGTNGATANPLGANAPSNGLGSSNPLDAGTDACAGGMLGFQCSGGGNLLDPNTGTNYCGPGSGTVGNTCVPVAVGSPPQPGAGACSFSPDTQVLLDHGKTKPIAKIKPGDKVEAADPKTGKHTGPRTVTATWINHDTDLTDVTIQGTDNKPHTLHTTSKHPFWDTTTHTWVPAGQLKPADTLNTDKNVHVKVLSIQQTSGAANRYNLTVAQLHTYYVLAGSTPVLVHNSGGAACKGPIPDKIPHDYYDQLAMQGAKAPGAGSVIMRNLGDTPRLEANYGPGEWVKMQSTLDDASGKAIRTVHWFRNLDNGMNVEYKFKLDYPQMEPNVR
jgi:RHS repeat-associated protein